MTRQYYSIDMYFNMYLILTGIPWLSTGCTACARVSYLLQTPAPRGRHSCCRRGRGCWRPTWLCCCCLRPSCCCFLSVLGPRLVTPRGKAQSLYSFSLETRIELRKWESSGQVRDRGGEGKQSQSFATFNITWRKVIAIVVLTRIIDKVFSFQFSWIHI